MPNARFDMARELFQNAYQLQKQGDFELAAQLYKRSIELHPTAEAHTFLGWTYHYQGKVDEAIPWLEQAIASQRYEAYHYPWYNLGRVYVSQEVYSKARECFRKALEIEPSYTLAEEALHKLRMLLQ